MNREDTKSRFSLDSVKGVTIEDNEDKEEDTSRVDNILERFSRLLTESQCSILEDILGS